MEIKLHATNVQLLTIWQIALMLLMQLVAALNIMLLMELVIIVKLMRLLVMPIQFLLALLNTIYRIMFVIYVQQELVLVYQMLYLQHVFQPTD